MKKIKQFVLMFVCLVSFTACKSGLKFYLEEDADAKFTGLSSIVASDSTATLHWTPFKDADEYKIYNVTSGSPVLVQTVSGQSSSSITITGLTPGQVYRFNVKMKNAQGVSDNNTREVSITMNMAPNAPTGLSLVTPAASPHIMTRPKILVSGVKSGDTIKLFSDSACTTPLAAGMAAGNTIELTTSSLSTAVHTIYANATNTASAASTCSTVNLTYESVSCPVNYVHTFANPFLGTDVDFCVMKFEAKDGGGGIAVSDSAPQPWNYITYADSQAACKANGARYDLITNAEWMTLARDIETVAVNWTGGSVGLGELYRGHSDNSHDERAVSDTTDPYNLTGNSAVSGMDQRRTMTLTSGGEVWDLAGNVMEWTQWVPRGTVTSWPVDCPATWYELPDVSCGLLPNEYMPGNPANITATNYNSAYGVGAIYGGTAGAALRGGFYANSSISGVFNILLAISPAASNRSYGFRCVYHP